MDFEASVGPQGVALGDGSKTTVRAGRTGCMVVTELHGRYFEQMRVGKMFSAGNQAAQAVSVALTTTYTGIMLYNPLNSGKILVPNKVKYALSVAQVAIATIGLIGGYSATGGVTAQTTKLTVQSNQIGNSGVGVGVPLSASTIVTPTWIAQICDGFTAGALAGPQLLTDFEGLFGILPGAFIGVGALTAVTGLGFMSWEEIDLPL